MNERCCAVHQIIESRQETAADVFDGYGKTWDRFYDFKSVKSAKKFSEKVMILKVF
jgi:hypothetical protein